jgi:WD40 repeat protein
LLAALALIACPSLRADPPTPQQLKDVDGDPFPAGAIARLGTTRWRLMGEPLRIVLLPGGKSLAVTTNSLTAELLDPNTGKRTLMIGTPGFISWGLNIGEGIAFTRDLRRAALPAAAEDGLTPVIRVSDLAGRGTKVDIPFKRTVDYKPESLSKEERESIRQAQWAEYVPILVFSPNGQVLAGDVNFTYECWDGSPQRRSLLKTEENSLRVWDAATGEERARMEGTYKQPIGLLFSPDGRTLIGADAAGGVRHWDTATGRVKKQWKSGRPARCAAFSPDEKWLALGGSGGVVVCDVATGKVRSRATLPPANPVSEVATVAFSFDGKLLAGGYGTSVRLWDPASGAVVRDGKPGSGAVQSVAFSTDGATLFTGHEHEHVVRRRDVSTLAPRGSVEGHAGQVRGLGFAADGKRLITASVAGEFLAWPARGGAPIPTPKGEEERLAVEWMAASGRTALLRCEDPLVRMMSVFTGAVPRLEDAMNLCGASVGGDRLLGESEKDKRPTLEVFEVKADKKPGKVLRTVTFKEGATVTGALSPDGRVIAAAGEGVVRFIDVETGKERRYEMPTAKDDKILRTSCVRFSPDGSRAAVIGDDGVLRVLAAGDGALLREIKKPDDDGTNRPPSGCVFSPDGKTLLTYSSFNEPALLWEVATGQRVRSYASPSLLVSPDGRLIALAEEETLRLYDIYSGKLFLEIPKDVGLTGNWVFSPDGGLLAASIADTTVLVWDTARTKGPRPDPLDQETLERLWQDVEGKEAPKAYEAIGKLTADPDRAVAFLRRKLQAVPPPTGVDLRKLIADLDADDFRTREAASRRLAELGASAEPAVRDAFAREEMSVELRTRLRVLIRNLDDKRGSLSPEERSHLRAIQVLEQVRTPEARRLLRSLAGGAEGAPRTRDARAALRRLQQPEGE